MNKHFGKDLTTGSIPKHLIRFALPVLFGNLLATGYSIINAIWVGNLLGKNAVGAVAVSFPFFLAMLALATGATLATSILIAKAYGAKNYEMIQKIVDNSWSIAIILIIVIPTTGIYFSGAILKTLGTPPQILNLAEGYLRINLTGFIFMYLSFLIVSILRGIGNTVIPMIFICISTAINAVLDPLFIMGLGPIPRMGLNGAAFASLIASMTAVIIGFNYIRIKYKGLPVNLKKLEFDGKLISQIILIGFPSFIQQTLISIGYACVTFFVNGFGPSAIAAFGITSRIDGIAAMPATAVMMSVSALTAQNLGAGKPERIKDIFKWGILINIPVILMVSLLCVSFPDVIVRIFVKDMAVIQIGAQYFRIVGVGYLFFIFIYVSNGVINGAGKTISTMIITFISLCLIRLPLAGILSRILLGLKGIWMAIVLSFLITTLSSFLYYLSGKWLKLPPIDKNKKEGIIIGSKAELGLSIDE